MDEYDTADRTYMEALMGHPEYGLLRVVAVADTIVGDWAAYQHHCRMPMLEVAAQGDKIEQAEAEALFPWFARHFAWRD